MKALRCIWSVAVISCWLAGPALAQLPATVRVAGWNQQGVRFNAAGPIPIDKPDQIRAALAALDADVVALSEVNSKASLQAALKEPLANGARYRFVMGEQPGPQKIAIVFRRTSGLSVTKLRPIPGSDDNNPDRLRKAWAANVRAGKFDFILIAVHNKSDRTGASRNTRSRQGKAIADFIATETLGKEKDVLVVGDYNMIPGQDDVNFAALSPGEGTGEFLRYISNERIAGQTTHIGSCAGNEVSGNHLDGFAISRGHTSEYVARSIRVVPLHKLMPGIDCGSYRATVSDHLPLLARFRATRDDD